MDSKEASDPTYTLKKFLSNAPNESELEHEDDDQNGALQEMSWEEQLQRLFTDLRASSTKTRQHALSGIALSCPRRCSVVPRPASLWNAQVRIGQNTHRNSEWNSSEF